MWSLTLEAKMLHGDGVFSLPLGERKTSRGARRLRDRIANQIVTVQGTGYLSLVLTSPDGKWREGMAA